MMFIRSQPEYDFVLRTLVYQEFSKHPLTISLLVRVGFYLGSSPDRTNTQGL